MKELGLRVGVIVLLTAIGSCAAGFGVSRADGTGVPVIVSALRDIGIILLALFSLIMAAVWGGLYFGAGWAVGRFGGKAPALLRWVGGKTTKVEQVIDQTAEKRIVRPTARVARSLSATTSFVTHASTRRAPASFPQAVVKLRSGLTRQLRWARGARPAAIYAEHGNEVASGLAVTERTRNGVVSDGVRSAVDSVEASSGVRREYRASGER